LRQGQIITSIDGKTISNINDYSDILQKKFPSVENTKTIIETKQGIEVILFSKGAPNITISTIPKTNLQLGLDLVGGSRALVKAQNVSLSQAELQDLVDTTKNRLNVYGLSDIKVSPVSDLSGNRFMLVEIAGATPKDLSNLLEQQGKFEAKIGNETVFIGGEKDIASVSRNAQDSRISCTSSGGNVCNFIFSVTLSPDAARRQAEITKTLGINSSNLGYLGKPLDLYVDDKFVESLLISKDLKGVVETQISISGSKQGDDADSAYKNAQDEMKRLQTILKTGSLPYQLEIVKLDTISPILGKNFISTIFLAGLVAILSVALVIFVRYRKFVSSIAILVISLSEIIIILGVAALIQWNLDLLSIAGILATIGTGIDSQIVILDEAKQKTFLSVKEKLKRAFKIILGSYFTALVSLLPLIWAGAGLLKGFVFTTVIGMSIGVLITRPAFTSIVRYIEE
jgi:preprotein translocase subunit SecD